MNSSFYLYGEEIEYFKPNKCQYSYFLILNDRALTFMSSTVSQEERQLNKGKEKEHKLQQAPHSSILQTSESETLDPISSYPPINDDAEETRRVEEASSASGQLAAL